MPREASDNNKNLNQRGVAAVEFALLLALMLLMLSGVWALWGVMQAQQSVVRATGDGARALQQLVWKKGPAQLPSFQPQVRWVVQQSLEGGGLPAPDRVEVKLLPIGTAAVLEVTYPYEFFDGVLANLAPLKTLRATSVVSVKPSP